MKEHIQANFELYQFVFGFTFVFLMIFLFTLFIYLIVKFTHIDVFKNSINYLNEDKKNDPDKPDNFDAKYRYESYSR